MKAPRVSRLMLASGLLAALVGCGSSPASPEPSPEPGPTTVEEIPPPPPAVAPGPAPERPSKVCVACGKALAARYPEMGAIVLECSMLPPYAKAVQDATGLPVFDFITMIDYFQAGTHRRPYHGYY